MIPVDTGARGASGNRPNRHKLLRKANSANAFFLNRILGDELLQSLFEAFCNAESIHQAREKISFLSELINYKTTSDEEERAAIGIAIYNAHLAPNAPLQLSFPYALHVELDKLLEAIQLDILMRSLAPTTFPSKSKLYDECLFRFLEESILFTLLHIVSKFVQSKPYDDFMRTYNATFGICRARNQNALDTARGGQVVRYAPVVSLPRDRKARFFQQDILDLQLHLQQEGVVKRLSGERRSRSVNITPERASAAGRRGQSIERQTAEVNTNALNNAPVALSQPPTQSTTNPAVNTNASNIANEKAVVNEAAFNGAVTTQGTGANIANSNSNTTVERGGASRTSLDGMPMGRATPERKCKLSGRSRLHSSAGATVGITGGDAGPADAGDVSDTNFNQIKTRVIYRHDEEYTTSLIAVFKESNKFDPSDFQLAGPQRTASYLYNLKLPQYLMPDRDLEKKNRRGSGTLLASSGVALKDASVLSTLCQELCTACWKNDLESVKRLLADCDVAYFINAFNSRGQTALYCAVRQGFIPIVAELLSSPCLDTDVQMSGHLGTALHAASFFCHAEICAMLLYAGASTAPLNANGLTCKQEALSASVAALFDGLDSKDGMEALKKAYPNVKKKPRLKNSLSTVKPTTFNYVIESNIRNVLPGGRMVDMKEVSCVFCVRDQVNFNCVWLSAYGVEEFHVDTNNKIVEDLTSTGSFTLSQIVSKLVSNYLVTNFALPLISIRDFKMKKKIAEEFIKIEQGVMEAYLVNQITVGLVVRTKYESTIEDFSDNKSISPALEYFVNKMAEDEEDSIKLYELRRRETTIFHGDRSGSSSLFTQKVHNLFGSNVALGGDVASGALSHNQQEVVSNTTTAGTASPKKLHLARREQKKRSPVNKRASTGSVPENLTPRSGKMSGVDNDSRSARRRQADPNEPNIEPNHGSNERRRAKELKDSLRDSEWVRMFLSPDDEFGAGSACDPAQGDSPVTTAQTRSSPKKGTNTNEDRTPHNSNDRTGLHVSFSPVVPDIPFFDNDVGQSETHMTRISPDPTELYDLERSQPSKRALFLSSTSCSQLGRDDIHYSEELFVANSLVASREGEVADSGGVTSGKSAGSNEQEQAVEGVERERRGTLGGGGSGGASGENSMGSTFTQSEVTTTTTTTTTGTTTTGTITQIDTPNTVTMSSMDATIDWTSPETDERVKMDQLSSDQSNISLLKQLLLNTIPSSATAGSISATARKKQKQQQEANNLKQAKQPTSSPPSRDPLFSVNVSAQQNALFSCPSPHSLGISSLNLAQLHFNTSESADDFGVDYGTMKSVRSRSRSRSSTRGSLSLSLEASPSVGGSSGSGNSAGKRNSSSNTSTSPAKLSGSAKAEQLAQAVLEQEENARREAGSLFTQEKSAIDANFNSDEMALDGVAPEDEKKVTETLPLTAHSDQQPCDPTLTDIIEATLAQDQPVVPDAVVEAGSLLSSSGFFAQDSNIATDASPAAATTATLNAPLFSGMTFSTGIAPMESTTTAISTQQPGSPTTAPFSPFGAPETFPSMTIPLISLSRQVVDTDFLSPNFPSSVPHTPTSSHQAPLSPIGPSHATPTTNPATTVTGPSLSPPHSNSPSQRQSPVRAPKPININANVHSIGNTGIANNSSVNISASPSPTITISSSPSPRSGHHSPVRAKFGHSLLRRAESAKSKFNPSPYGVAGEKTDEGERFDNEVINTSSSLPAQIKYTWNDVTTTWNIAPKMSRDEIRRYVGNSQCVVVFDEYDTNIPFDPSNLFLGKVTNYVLVVKSLKYKNDSYCYRLGHFLHYEEKWIEKEVSENQNIFSIERKIMEIDFAPLIPKDFVFGHKNIRSVVMILLHNSVVCSHKHHSQIRKLVTWPQRSNLIKTVAKFSL